LWELLLLTGFLEVPITSRVTDSLELIESCSDSGTKITLFDVIVDILELGEPPISKGYLGVSDILGGLISSRFIYTLELIKLCSDFSGPKIILFDVIVDLFVLGEPPISKGYFGESVSFQDSLGESSNSVFLSLIDPTGASLFFQYFLGGSSNSDCLCLVKTLDTFPISVDIFSVVLLL